MTVRFAVQNYEKFQNLTIYFLNGLVGHRHSPPLRVKSLRWSSLPASFTGFRLALYLLGFFGKA